MLLALSAALLASKLGISVALVEIVVGALAGNTLHPEITPWITFLASLGAVMLTFLAGAELDSAALRQQWKASLAIGTASFLLPFLLCWFLARYLLGWDPRAAQIAGIALSTTSVAVVYAVTVETGLNTKPLGKLLLAACFVTDLGTVLLLGLLFAPFDLWSWILLAGLLVSLPLLRRFGPVLLEKMSGQVSESEVKFLCLVLGVLALLAVKGGSEGVLPAYLVGTVLADHFLRQRQLLLRVRAITFGLLTPFFFLQTGSLVDLRAVAAGLGLLVALFLAKVGAKLLGIMPVAALFRLTPRSNLFTSLLMSTGLTFGSISALYGLTHGFLSQEQYSILVTAVIITAIVPSLVAQGLFLPRERETYLSAAPASPETSIADRKGGR